MSLPNQVQAILHNLQPDWMANLLQMMRNTV